MRTLILMRHAKSSWDDPVLADHDRPLNDRGVRSARAMGDWLRRGGHVPECCLSSTSRRTCETFEELGIDVPLMPTRHLYHVGPDEMMDVLSGAKEATVLMLGHNPGIAAFAERLLRRPPAHPRFADYPTCATLVARFEGNSWNETGWHEGQPIAFAIPREVMSRPSA